MICVNYLSRVAFGTNQLQFDIARFFHKASEKTKKFGKPIISCKRPEYDHYARQTYSKFDGMHLASGRWDHKKSRGDYFTIHGNANVTKKLVPPPTIEKFSSLGLDTGIEAVLNDMGIISPTDIQARAIPKVLSGSNTLITAETGCGKTLAYLLPLLQQLLQWKPMMPQDRFNRPLALVITPSRELAIQIGSVAEGLFSKFNLKTKTIVGGRTKRLLINPTFEESDVLIATLGGLSKLVSTGIYKVDCIRHVILDEADTLLDDSFSDKLSYFLRKIPFHYGQQDLNATDGCLLTMASATLPKEEIPEVLSAFIHPESIKKAYTDQLHHVMPHVPQKFLRMAKVQKPIEVLRLVRANMNHKFPVMIFSNKTATCDWLSIFLNENDIPCINLNGEMSVMMKEGRFEKFSKGEINVLSCTDVASRGLDTIRVKHVINYDFPIYTADYIHRCGRTGRIGSGENCFVTNFVASQTDVKLVQKIEESVRLNLPLPGVDGNITKVLRKKIERRMEQLEHMEEVMKQQAAQDE